MLVYICDENNIFENVETFLVEFTIKYVLWLTSVILRVVLYGIDHLCVEIVWLTFTGIAACMWLRWGERRLQWRLCFHFPASLYGYFQQCYCYSQYPYRRSHQPYYIPSSYMTSIRQKTIIQKWKKYIDHEKYFPPVRWCLLNVAHLCTSSLGTHLTLQDNIRFFHKLWAIFPCEKNGQIGRIDGYV